MNPQDLLYTNTFKKSESLSKNQLDEDANNFIPYRTLKSDSVNNVRDDLERSVFTNNPIVQRETKAYGWNRGGLGNQKPVLSDFARDVGESTYFKYRTSYLNIDSRMRDYLLYPYPNNYQVFLGRKFDNIESIKLIDYFFPDVDFPINETNNVLMWFLMPANMLAISPAFPPFYANINGKINICNWGASFERLINFYVSCVDSVIEFRNIILKCLFVIEIPPGYYTTEQLAKTIESLWRKQLFYDSTTFLTDDFIKHGTQSDVFVDMPQLIKVRIDPNTSYVDFMLRYEELHIDKMVSYYGKNYIDIRLKSLDPNVASTEFTLLINNDIYPLIPTDFPGIGGINQDNINYNEFVTKTQHEQFVLLNIYKNYYEPIIVDGNIIPNVLRLYFYTLSYKTIICSSTDEITVGLTDALIGRESPFFLIKGTNSPLFSFIQRVGNRSDLFNQYNCTNCETDPTSSDCIPVIPQSEVSKINGYLCNLDGSSRLLTNLLGFLDTANSLAQVGPVDFGFAINPNTIYKANLFINTVQTLNITTQESIEYQDCVSNIDPSFYFIFNTKFDVDIFLNFKLPICRDQDGKFSFYVNNYMFIKLLNPLLTNQLSSSQIVQVRSTSTFANGSSDLYEYDLNRINLSLEMSPNPVTAGFNCPIPSLYTAPTGNQQFSKDVDNLFAKIKFSGNIGSCVVENPYVNEVMYFEGNVTNLDSFVVQLVDYQGKIIQRNRDHSFTLMIIEKIEILKETNINTRTGYVNSSGTQQVLRNNYGM